MVMVSETVLGFVGDTPYVDVSRLVSTGSKVYGKLECLNPLGSVKDRAALNMISIAEQDGSLKPGMGIIEPTSGNTGIALAAIALVKGYEFTAVLPDNSTPERIAILEAYRANILLTPGKLGPDGSIATVKEITANNDTLFSPYQYGNKSNPNAHAKGTGPEIARDFPDVTDFVSSMGTSGTITGVGAVLRSQNPAVELHGVQTAEGHRIPGIRNYDVDMTPDVYLNWGVDLDPTIHYITLPDAHTGCSRLLEATGVLAGPSSGAAFHIALQIAEQSDDRTVVFIVCDKGNNYLAV